jgi:hypothetical protein
MSVARGSPSDSGESQPERPLISVPLGPVCRRPGESAARPLERPTWHVGHLSVVAVSEKKNWRFAGQNGVGQAQNSQVSGTHP